MNDAQWSRRALLKAAVAAPAALAVAPARAAELDVPEWIAAGKLRWVWALWEPIELYTRGGFGAGIGDGRATGHWIRKWHDRMLSDEILDKLAAVGVNLVSTQFYKGFGLKAEAAEMARAKDFTRRAHARGIRVLGYHQFSTVIYETMLDEVPHLADWIQRDADGKLRTYGSASWRWMACPVHDDFMAYLKRVMERCLNDAGMDGVEFDGTSYECYCDKCQAAFRQYCAEHNPQPLERFGIPHFRHARIPPRFDAKDPLSQEWARFRIQLMGGRLREMREFVHRTKPGAALVTYSHSPAGVRKGATRSLPDEGSYIDLGIDENHDMPQVMHGELVTKVRRLKEGTANERVILSTDWIRTPAGGIKLPDDPKPVELDMAECLACGGHVLTATWALRSGDKRDGSAFFEQPAFNDALKRYMGFEHAHEDLYVGSRPCANVWIYHSPASLNVDHGVAYNSVMGFEQAMLGRVAWRIARPRHLPELGRRDVLIVASQTCLSASECAAIRAAAGRGCGIVITGATGDCDENFRQRETPELHDLRVKPNVRYFAKCPAATRQTASPMHPTMPEAAAEIVKTVGEMARQGLAAELAGGDSRQPLAFVDVYRVNKAAVAHVVYYGDGRPEGFRLRVAPWLAAGKPVLYSPHMASPAPLTAAGGWMELPASFGRYAVVRFS
ncbi:MAG TPA: hypothetical protein VN442_17300 [Bryobacteraceae bacterium]|nr:hypothetical protein [Bryobacteraceae bacterium]